MKKTLLLMLSVISLLECASPLAAFAKNDAAKSEDVLYYDDFSSKGVWEGSFSRGFSIRDGMLKFSKTSKEELTPTVTAKAYSFDNASVTFETTMKKNSEFSFYARSDGQSSYRMDFSGKNGTVALRKSTNNGLYTRLAQGSCDFTADGVSTINVNFFGTRILVYVNNELVIDVQDESIGSGYIAFSAETGEFYADNLEISRVDPELIEKAEKKLSKPIEIYIGKDGDSNYKIGSYENPYKTIEDAKMNIIAAKSSGAPIDVIYKEGEYSISEKIILDESFSGSAVSPVTIKGEENKEIVFTGKKSIDISKFQEVTDEEMLERMSPEARGKILCVDLAAQGFERSKLDFISWGKDYSNGKYGYVESGSRMPPFKLFLNDRNQQLSRWPNSGYAYMVDVQNNGANNNVHSKLYFSEEEPLRWTKATTGYVQGTMYYQYLTERMYIYGVDAKNMCLELGWFNRYGIRKDQPWCAYNLIEEIDYPGEYVFDPETMLLYYYPQKELTSEDTLDINYFDDTLLEIDNAKYLTIENITFERNGGDLDNSTDISVSRYDGIGINPYADFITIKDCKFRDIGRFGIYTEAYRDPYNGVATAGYKSLVIDGCDFYRCNEGVSVGAGYIFKGSRNKGNYIVKNCYFNSPTPYSALRNSNAGTAYGGTVSQNLFSNSRYGTLNVAMVDGVVDRNEFSYNATEAADYAVIYMGRSPIMSQGMTISNNLIHHYGPDRNDNGMYTGGIYFDDLHAGVTVTGNMTKARFADAPGSTSTGLIESGGPDMKYYGNINYGATAGITLQNRPGQYGTGGITNYYVNAEFKVKNTFTDPEILVKFPHMARYGQWRNDRLTEDYDRNSEIRDNISSFCKKGTDKQGFDKAPYPTGRNDDAIVIDDDSIYVDIDNLDMRITKEAKEKYNLSDDLPCEDNIDIESIGIQRDLEYREDLKRFNATYPEKNQVFEYSNRVRLAWEMSDPAEEYEWFVWEDEAMTKPAASGKTSYTAVDIDTLEPGKTYYWKVNAISYARTQGFTEENANGLQVFKTGTKTETTTKLLTEYSQQLSELIKTINEGKESGQYFIGTKASYKEVLQRATKHLTNEKATQAEIDASVAEIKKLIANNNSKKNSGFKSLPLNSSIRTVTTTTLSEIKMSDGELKIDFDKTATVNVKNTLEINDIQCFKTKVDQLDSGFVIYTLRQNDALKAPWATPCYYFLVKPYVIELQSCRSNGGTMLEAVSNENLFTPGEWHDIEFGAVNTEEGVNLVLNIDGKQVFDYFDATPSTDNMKEGSFSFYSNAGRTVWVQSAENVPTELFKFSDKIQDYLDNGVPVYFNNGATTVSTPVGKWETTGYMFNGVTSEYACSEKDAKIVYETNGDYGREYRIYYYHHPSKDGDKAAKILVEGLNVKEEFTVDFTQGEEGYVELCTVPMTGFDGTGHTTVSIIGSGEGKVLSSSVMIRKVNEE